MPDLSVVIACYNEERVLEASVGEIDRVLRQIHCDYEMIFVEDCSRDRTREIIAALCESDPRRRSIFHESNVGRGGTVMDGFRAATGKYVGFLDIDLEVHARYIPSMLNALEDGADVASAYRIYKVQLCFDDIFRDVLSVGYRWLVRRLLHLPLKDTEAGYKFFRREAILPSCSGVRINSGSGIRRSWPSLIIPALSFRRSLVHLSDAGTVSPQ